MATELKEEIVKEICKEGAIIDLNWEEKKRQAVLELQDEGLIISCDKIIDRHPKMMNPSYTYVANDEVGLNLAKDNLLFTRCIN